VPGGIWVSSRSIEHHLDALIEGLKWHRWRPVHGELIESRTHWSLVQRLDGASSTGTNQDPSVI
jgi:hypothetical protein